MAKYEYSALSQFSESCKKESVLKQNHGLPTRNIEKMFGKYILSVLKNVTQALAGFNPANITISFISEWICDFYICYVFMINFYVLCHIVIFI